MMFSEAEGKIVETSYHHKTLDPTQLKETAEKLVRKLESAQLGQIDAIAVRGISGIGMGAVVSMLSRIPLVVVRKLGESSHGREIEGMICPLRRYVILDDVIFTGNTVRQIQFALLPAKCVGIFLYGESDRIREKLEGVPVFGTLV